VIVLEVWRKAWWLAKHEMKRGWGGWIVSIIFFLYAAVVLGTMAGQEMTVRPGKAVYYVSGIGINLFALAVIPNLGFFFSRRHFTYFRKDSFTKRLAFLKRLPVSDEVLLISRYMQLVVATACMSVVLFLPIFIVYQSDLTPVVRLSAWEFVEFSLIWIGYSLAMGSFYVYWEMGSSGKTYFTSCLLIAAAYLLVGSAAFLINYRSLWILAMQGVKAYGPMLPLLSLLLGIGSLLFWSWATKRRLERRDLQ
jgi:hypothetical protein